MKKQILIFTICTIGFIFNCLTINAQKPLGIWTWMKGDSALKSLKDSGSFGIKGTYSAFNYPGGAFYESNYWIDKDGDFWFLGDGYRGNAFWEYNPSLNQFRWMGGERYGSLTTPNYGTQGIPSPLNYPDEMALGATCWTDKNGDFWLYGGACSKGILGVLWRFNVATNEWTWMNGNLKGYELPVYTDSGKYSYISNPGDRFECKTGWVDDSNNLWLFGGWGGDSNATINWLFNDIWKYNIRTNQWMWVRGKFNSSSLHGSAGVEGSDYTPCARSSYAHWVDDSGYFYIFGGFIDSVYNGVNDLWRFNTHTHNWAWLSGFDSISSNGFYHGYGNVRNKSMPQSRCENMSFILKNCPNKLWMLGGYDNRSDLLNDLWYYDIIKRQWYWAAGDSVANSKPFFGKMGVPDLRNNLPRTIHSPNWVDRYDNFWLIPAYKFVPYHYNLWRFTPFQTSDSIHNTINIEICKDSSYTLNTGYKIHEPGTYNDTLITSNNCVQLTRFITITLKYKNSPSTFNKLYNVCAYDSVVLKSDSIKAATYLWNTLDTTKQIKINQPGLYTLAVQTSYCKPVYDTFLVINKLCDSLIYLPAAFTPNSDGKNDIFRILGEPGITIKDFKIYNRWGALVFESQTNGWDGNYHNQPQPQGTYMYTIQYTIGDKTFFKKGDVELIR